MRFSAPDPNRYRISDCGRYIIEKIVLHPNGEPQKAETRYCVWMYQTQAGGYDTFDAAVEAVIERDRQRWFRAPDVGTVNSEPQKP